MLFALARGNCAIVRPSWVDARVEIKCIGLPSSGEGPVSQRHRAGVASRTRRKILISTQVDASRAARRWVEVEDHLAGYGPPRPAGSGRRILDGLAVHVAPTALGPKDPSASTLTALVSAAGGRSVALRHAAVALVGADWKAANCRQAGLRALHRSGSALRFRWLCECVEAGDAGAVQKELYATNR